MFFFNQFPNFSEFISKSKMDAKTIMVMLLITSVASKYFGSSEVNDNFEDESAQKVICRPVSVRTVPLWIKIVLQIMKVLEFFGISRQKMNQKEHESEHSKFLDLIERRVRNNSAVTLMQNFKQREITNDEEPSEENRKEESYPEVITVKIANTLHYWLAFFSKLG